MGAYVVGEPGRPVRPERRRTGRGPGAVVRDHDGRSGPEDDLVEPDRHDPLGAWPRAGEGGEIRGAGPLTGCRVHGRVDRERRGERTDARGEPVARLPGDRLRVDRREGPVKRLAISLTFFLVLSLVIGYLLSGPSLMDWGVAGGLFAIAVAGECFRFWLRRTRAKKHASPGI